MNVYLPYKRKEEDMRKKIGCMVLFVLLYAVAAVGCGKKEDQSVAEIQSGGVLRVAVPDTESVLFCQDEETGTYQGEEAELVALIAEALGVSVQYLPADRESFVGQLSAGEADIAIGSIMEDSYLVQNHLYSTSYGSGYVYVVTLRGLYAGDITVFSDKAVGVSAQLAPESANDLYAVDGITLQSYDNISSVSADLVGGKIAGYVCYQPEAEALLELGDYQAQDAVGVGREDYVILAPSGSSKLIEGVNLVIRQYRTEPQENEAQEDTQ